MAILHTLICDILGTYSHIFGDFKEPQGLKKA